MAERFIERGPRKISPELLELLKNPLEVFDSPIEKAQKQHRDLMEHLKQRRDVHRIGKELEVSIETVVSASVPTIEIAWPIDRDTAMLLQLNPITEGKGSEKGVLAYRGIYGLAKKPRLDWQLDPQKSYSLEQVFGIPDGLNLVIKPTIDRWAIAKDEMAVLFGDKTRTLFMGLGFLFLGHQWMHIGMHEAGHLPDTHDENKAWEKANTMYARRHRQYKKEIINQRYLGQFELLKRPNWYSHTPTLGKIMKYGLVSHSFGGTRIPKHWKADALKTMEDFQSVIQQAHDAYTHVLGMY